MYAKLLKVDFENIELTFKDNKKILFSKSELETYLEYQNNRVRNRRVPVAVKKLLESLNLEEIKNRIKSHERLNTKDRKIISDFISENDIPRFAPTDIMIREIFRFLSEPKFENFIEINNILNSEPLANSNLYKWLVFPHSDF